MKQRIFFIAIILILLINGNSFGFMETRHQWWEARLRQITAEKARLEKSAAADKQVLALLDNNLRRARGIIAVFESDRRNDGSLTHESRTITEADIAAEAAVVVPPLCALRQLELMVSDEGDIEAARAIVQPRLASMMTAAFTRGTADIDSVVGRIMKEDIRSDEWNTIATELRLGRIIEDGPRFREQCRAETIRAVAAALAARNNTANGKELRALVTQRACDVVDGYCIHPLESDSLVLDKAHSWRRVQSALEKDLSSYKTILALMPGSTVPLDRVRHLLKNPDELDSALFRGERNAFAGIGVPFKSTAVKKAGGRVLEIPPVTGFLPAIEAMEKMRKSMILTASGREDKQFFDALRKKLDSEIARHTNAAKKRFTREEQNLTNEKGAGGETARAFSNENEFREAQRSFEKGIALLNDSAKMTIDFISLVTSSKKMESGEIVSGYRYQARRDREYLQYLSGLVSECSRLPEVNDPASAKRFTVAYARTGGIFTFAGTALSLDARYRPFLSKQDRALIVELTTEFSAAIQSMKGDLRACRDRFSRTAAADAGDRKQTRESLDEKIAQEDIDAHYRYAEECVVLFERYRYAGEAFEKYNGLFDAFTRQARSGAVSSALESTIKNASLLASLSDFDANRIRAEYESKRLLHAEAVTALSRLATLVQFYRKHGVTVKDIPSAEEISSLQGRFAPPARTRIDAWVMNETNFREIDRKAARKLSLILDRGASGRETTAPGDTTRAPEARTVIRLQEPELSLSLPRGWEEEQLGDTELYQGIVKSFHAGDGMSFIQLVKLPLENGDAKDAAEEWIKKGGRSLVEKQWRKTNNLDCLFILSHDRKKNLSQTCALSVDGFAVLITGTTTRNRYQSFKEQFMKIIGSVQAGRM
jgi:hypothetical protein